MPKIYELVDATGPETYYTIGLFNCLGRANHYLLSLDSPIGEHGDCECHTYEIRERELNKVGWSETGEVFARFNLVEVYDEEKDENQWRLEVRDA